MKGLALTGRWKMSDDKVCVWKLAQAFLSANPEGAFAPWLLQRVWLHGALAMWNGYLRMALYDQLGRQSFSSSSSSAIGQISAGLYTEKAGLEQFGVWELWRSRRLRFKTPFVFIFQFSGIACVTPVTFVTQVVLGALLRSRRRGYLLQERCWKRFTIWKAQGWSNY